MNSANVVQAYKLGVEKEDLIKNKGILEKNLAILNGAKEPSKHDLLRGYDGHYYSIAISHSIQKVAFTLQIEQYRERLEEIEKEFEAL